MDGQKDRQTAGHTNGWAEGRTEGGTKGEGEKEMTSRTSQAGVCSGDASRAR
jgi:hypothetical protein